MLDKLHDRVVVALDNARRGCSIEGLHRDALIGVEAQGVENHDRGNDGVIGYCFDVKALQIADFGRVGWILRSRLNPACNGRLHRTFHLGHFL